MLFANCRLSVFRMWRKTKARGFKIHGFTPINPLASDQASKDLEIKSNKYKFPVTLESVWIQVAEFRLHFYINNFDSEQQLLRWSEALFEF